MATLMIRLSTTARKTDRLKMPRIHQRRRWTAGSGWTASEDVFMLTVSSIRT